MGPSRLFPVQRQGRGALTTGYGGYPKTHLFQMSFTVKSGAECGNRGECKFKGATKDPLWSISGILVGDVYIKSAILGCECEGVLGDTLGVTVNRNLDIIWSVCQVQLVIV